MAHNRIVTEQVVIPARGGSKGVPGKNVRVLGSRTLIANAVLRAIDAGVDRVVVTTDDDDIAMSAAGAGAKIVSRPAELATDTAAAADAIRHALQYYPCERLAIVQCTSPMLHPDDITRCLDRLQAGRPRVPFEGGREPVDLVVCCVEFDGIVLDASGRLANHQPGLRPNRQQRASQWVVCGNCWACRPEYLEQPWMSGRIGIVPARYPHRLEIDSEADLALASLVVYSRQDVAYPAG